MDKNKIFPDDTIRVILYSAYISHPDMELDEEWLHTLIHISKAAFPQLFEEFSFNTSGTHPYSELLERIIMRARIAGVLSSSNQLTHISDKYVKEILYPKFSPENLSILQSIGKRFL